MVGNIEKNTKTSAWKSVAHLLKLFIFANILGHRILVFQRRGIALLLESWSLLIPLRLKHCLVRC
jgi:hypothetical protein